jgi:hypothetical protein
MSVHDDCPAIKFGGPATYRIVVQGILSEHWRDCLAGLAVVDISRGPDDAPRTTLVGRIRDQAELNGVLGTLYGLHLPILRVETINEALHDAFVHTPAGSPGTH